MYDNLKSLLTHNVYFAALPSQVCKHIEADSFAAGNIRTVISNAKQLPTQIPAPSQEYSMMQSRTYMSGGVVNVQDDTMLMQYPLRARGQHPPSFYLERISLG